MKQMDGLRILLLGNIGQVGFELQRSLSTLGDVIAVDRPAVELSEPDSIRQVVRANTPQVIINAAAYTAVDKAEEEPELARKINAIAPGIMAEEAKRLGALFITYSTDYVFDGGKAGPYTELDQPNPLSVYGRTKTEGDAAVQAVGGSFLIFRTSWVFGARGKNFFLTMLKLLQERESLQIVNDQVGAPTWSRSIAEATAQIIAQQVDSTRNPARPAFADKFAVLAGIYNLTCRDKTSWYGFTEWIAQRLAATGKTQLAKLRPISSEEYPLPAKRPINSALDNQKLLATFGISLPRWKEAAGLVFDSDKLGTFSGHEREAEKYPRAIRCAKPPPPSGSGPISSSKLR
jgi:dTDP-4-dehydrorhamnose reductase